MNQKQRQEVFDKACRGILAQGCKSWGTVTPGTPACLYRSDTGAKCAVGHLITDEHYNPYIERKAVSHEPVMEAVENSLGYLLYSWDVRFLQELQTVHDGTPRDCSFISGFKERARAFAKKYKLSVKVLDQ